ncbi:MAG: YciI family protein [Gemmatales bacterium]|nr:YciI family protein [Gemmatales bacterium]MDW8176834.1 YciI family protein [Gemmatales bacterium]MDW8221726.1 YciI family protein [Gemmatales bacterium]
MKFAAIIEYTADRQKIQTVRPIHRQYLAQLKEQGKLVASGPFTDDSGALIIYEASDRQEAEQLLSNDPFCREGIFVTWQLRPWNPVLANRALLPE